MNLPKETKEILEALAPELAESEDERIRKALIKLMTVAGESYILSATGFEKERFLSYLEKQKEQKPAQSEEEKEYVRTLKGLVSDFIRNSGGGITDVEYYQNICDWLDGRHIEQKPNIEICPHSIKSKSYLETDYPIEQKPVVTHGETYHVDTLGTQQVIAGKMPQNPAEWSEEDSDNLERVDNYLWMLDDYVGDDCATPQGKADKIRENIQKVLSPWLKSLPERFNLPPKQEWSEEDEGMLNSCISSIEEAKENRYAYKETDGDTSYDHEIDWLKSLRPVSKESLQPHWKPSEHQMSMLLAVVNDPNNAGSESCYISLKSLYNDLKKL